MPLAPIKHVFIDCDDCLYKNDWATARRLSRKLTEYCVEVLGLPEGKNAELYKRYGTGLRGLIEEQLLGEDGVDEYLRQGHDVPLDDIQPDPALREMLRRIPHPLWCFTASIREHAERCLRRLGIEDLFLGIVATSSRDMIERVGYTTKHDPRCFTAAMALAGVPAEEAGACILLDDGPRNLRTAKAMGWRTVLVGLTERGTGRRVECEEADVAVDTLHEVEEALPELFVSPQEPMSPASLAVVPGLDN